MSTSRSTDSGKPSFESLQDHHPNTADVLAVDSLSSSNPPTVYPDTSLVVTPSPRSDLSLTVHLSLGPCQRHLSMVAQSPINLCRSLRRLLPRMVLFFRRVSQFMIIWHSSGLFFATVPRPIRFSRTSSRFRNFPRVFYITRLGCSEW
jgi:hypothetical protein